MAKKVVASFKTGAENKGITKVIRMVKSQKTGAYEFKEEFMQSDLVKDALSSKKK